MALRRSWIILAWLAAAAAGASPAAAQAGQPALAESDRADQLFADAKRAAAEQDWRGAYALLLRAFQLKSTYDIAGNLGHAAFQLGKMRDAAEYLSYCINHFPATGDHEKRARSLRALDVAKTEVASVKLEVEPPTAEVFVGDRALGPAAALPPELFVDPGRVRFVARADGYSDAQAELSAVRGRQHQLRLTLEKLAPAAAATGAEAGPGAVDGASEPVSLWPPIVGGAIATAALGAGVVLMVSAASSERDAERLLDEVGPNGCGAGTPNESVCRELSDANDSTERSRNWAGASFALAGVAAAASLAYVLWPRSSGREQAVRAVPIASRNGGGLGIVGNF
jgi:hypothetical protein